MRFFLLLWLLFPEPASGKPHYEYPKTLPPAWNEDPLLNYDYVEGIIC